MEPTCLADKTIDTGNQPTTAKLESNINVYKWSKYVNLTSLQAEEVANISVYFTEQMEKASGAKKNKEEKLHKAVYGNLKLMKKTLTPEQYTKYVALMNMTLKNRGIDVK